MGARREKVETMDVEVNSAVFAGELHTQLPPSENQGPKKVVRLGFAAARAYMPWYLQDVSDFDALEIKLKSDGRRYTVNLQPESFFGDDLYQGYLVVDKMQKGEWVVAKLPFSDLLLTGRGRVKEVQRSFDHDQVTSLGVSIADDQSGPFRLEVEYIRAARM